MAAAAARAAAGAEDACGSPEAFAAWTEELLSLEQEAEGEETTELLVSCTHPELQARGIALLKLVVAEQTTALYGRACLTLERQGGAPLPVHRITHGDIVGLFDQSARPISKAVPLASAVVQRVLPSGISLAFDGEIPVEVLDGRLLHAALISSEVTLKRYREALDQLKSGRLDGPAAGLVSLCFSSDQKPRYREAKSELCCREDAVDCAFRAEQSHRLNEPQQAAVVKALCALDVAVIHGPPGTGKTTTLVAYILEAIYRKQRLLVTAPSNVAVDNLLERVVDCGCHSVVRLGHPARVQSDLHRYTLDNVVYASEQAGLCRDIKKEIDDALKRSSGRGSKAKEAVKVPKGEVTALRKELRQRERRAVAEVLRHTQVVFATCTGAATLHREIRRSGDASVGTLEFDVAIIDEAAQALEVACWIPLLLGKKAVLAGDHQQLAACVKSNEAQRRGLDRTLFGRLIEQHGDDVAALLSIQYRMNAAIMGWSSRSFYSSRLEAAESVASRQLELQEVPEANLVGDTLQSMHAPFLFVDTGGLPMYREESQEEAEERPGASRATHAAVFQSRANPGEARFVVHYAKMLVKCGLAPKNMTVITPYNRQVERLRAEFADDSEVDKLGLTGTRVNTVDSFQGQEADAVLISLVRSNERGVVGFLADYRRLNVAVTRARKQVMLVGDAATISTNSMLASLYDYACDSGKVVFVQQLMDESGGVPPDPAAVPEPRRPAKAERLLGQQGKEKRQEKGLDEQKVRERLERQLRPLVEHGGFIDFPPTLNPFERAIAHDLASSLGLLHESRGEGMERRLLVRAPGCEPPAESAGAASSSSNTPQPKPKPKPKSKPTPTDKEPSQVIQDSDSDTELETALQAFERRAAALLDALGPQEPAAEWKGATDEELEILERLAASRGLELLTTGGGKKRKCRVEYSGSGEAAAATEKSTADAAGASRPAASSAPTPPAPSAVGPNAMLAELHAQKERRRAEEASRRQAENAAAKAELKQAKQAGKQPKTAAAQDPDDLDDVLREFAAKEGVCAFGTCREKVNTMIDAISLCRLCSKRFCLRHSQAELHGCGDAAQRTEQKKWKQSCEAAANPRGSGLVNKPCGDTRNQVANKLQEKIKGKEEARSTKKKDGKKK